MDELLGDPIPLDDLFPGVPCCNPDPPVYKPEVVEPLPPFDPLFGG
jgi:hypothetical protein